MEIHESGENYLETIFILSKTNAEVRSIDIANELKFSKPSISRAVSILKRDGYINMSKTGNITLTEKGYAHATQIYERHTLLTNFLIKLGVSSETADKDACRIEHVISPETFEKIKNFYN